MPKTLFRFMCTSDGGDPTSWLVMAKDDGHAMDVGFKKYPNDVFAALNTMWGVDEDDDDPSVFWTTESVLDRLEDEDPEAARTDLAYQLSTVIGLEGLPNAYYEAMAKGLYQHLTRNQKNR